MSGYEAMVVWRPMVMVRRTVVVVRRPMVMVRRTVVMVWRTVVVLLRNRNADRRSIFLDQGQILRRNRLRFRDGKRTEQKPHRE